MRIAFVGKGGSGKSTVSALFVQACLAQEKKVLAIDLDYNMDLAYNLGCRHDLGECYISRSRPDFYAYTKLPQNSALKELIGRFDSDLVFDPDNPADSYSAKYARDQGALLKLMVVGPTPDDRLYGKECGHVFMSPIRYYLPFLQTDRVVVMDSTAGTDLVSFGMYQGADMIICVVEPRDNALRVFEQIRPIAKEFNIPLYMFVNKYQDSARTLLDDYSKDIIGSLPLMDVDRAIESHSPILSHLYCSINKMAIDKTLRQSRLKQWKAGHDAAA